MEEVRAYLAVLPRPLFLLHTICNTVQNVKRVSDSATRRLYHRLLDHTDGSLVLLDWDNRVPRLNSWHVHHLRDDWHALSVEELIAAYSLADVLIGVDSGPLHLAGLFGLQAVAVWPVKEHDFSKYLVPRPNQVSLVSSRVHEANAAARGSFNLREFGGLEMTGDDIADAALALLRPRYLPESKCGADAMLQQWVLDWERGGRQPAHLAGGPALQL